MNKINDECYMVSTVTQTIGGDKVIHYEATSYTTTADQEILYADNVVTVHRPIFTGNGIVSFNGGMQELTYNDRKGNPKILTGISNYNHFSGGDVISTTSPNDAITHGSGKLYISDDGMTITVITSNIISPEITGIIRRDAPTDFMVDANQFSSVYDGIFNISTDTATVTYPGGGIIWWSMFNNRRDVLYVDDENISYAIEQAVSSLLLNTKSIQCKIYNIIFNGRDIYSYNSMAGNKVQIPPSGFIDYANMTLSVLQGGTYVGYDMMTVFDGAEVKQIKSTTSNQRFKGPGLLLLPKDSNKAFYTTHRPTINYLTQDDNVMTPLSGERVACSTIYTYWLSLSQRMQ